MMVSRLRRWLPAARAGWLLLLVAAPLPAAEPQIGYVYPAGGRQGTTLDLTIGGQFLQEASGVVHTGDGLRGEVVDYHIELTPQELNGLRNRMEKLVQSITEMTGEERGRTETQIAEIRATFKEQGFDETGKQRLKGAKRDPRKQLNPQLREQVTLRCSIDPTAAAGPRELRIQTPRGLSNAILFHVGQVPELIETEPNDREPVAAQEITLPAVVNGQVMPGDIDRFRIGATQGQRLVCKVAARRLVPYMADAVPGWFQAVLTLYDDEGHALLLVDDDHFDPDPLLVYDVPADGHYVLEIRDAIYRGREDFTYRLTLADGLKMDGPLPTAARGPAPAPGDAAEVEPNNTPPTAQPVQLPLMLHGHIDPPGDWDHFAFDGRAGQSVVIETIARRAGSPLDSLLQLRDPAGAVLQVSDDHVDPREGLTTHHADSYVNCTLPTNGRYTVYLGDLQGKGGADHAYRLRIGTAQPDFELRVTPATLSMPAGGTAPLVVHIQRRDGFAGGVTLALANAPEKCHLSGGYIPPGVDKVSATLTMPAAMEEGPVRMTLVGRTPMGDRTLTRQAVAAEDRMQAFLWRHLVPVEDWIVSVIGDAKFMLKATWPAEGPLVLIAGRKNELILHHFNREKPIRGGPRFELYDPPTGLTLAKTTFRNRNCEAVLEIEADPETLADGARGNLMVTVLGPNKKVRNVLAFIPAIPFEVIYP